MVRTTRAGDDNQADRMSLWLQNVESERFLLFSVGLELTSLQKLLLRRDKTLKLLGLFNQYHSHLLHPLPAEHLSEGHHNACLGRSSQLTRSLTRMAKPAPALLRPLVHRPPQTLRLSLSPNHHKLALSSKRPQFCFLKPLHRALQGEGGQRW